ncbi:restriction endonuclease [Erysipelothrix rhusiopathiae]|nr:restriction endonuclease [Erysipelothrix rhusiopathiae]MDE8086097.1 restriction endonuclease [Erysipelothrix rhusiopathiae]MDE8089621.1 restriction endonuclease [Erysipelothrix rhusiopathiae]MDE8096218.1 restriction endonuclease [Erysipelothrix rhusiopathiae]MDE8101388.1 restriction endonuclease [Erysipelothrix rhusiopathiae]
MLNHKNNLIKELKSLLKDIVFLLIKALYLFVNVVAIFCIFSEIILFFSLFIDQESIGAFFACSIISAIVVYMHLHLKKSIQKLELQRTSNINPQVNHIKKDNLLSSDNYGPKNSFINIDLEKKKDSIHENLNNSKIGVPENITRKIVKNKVYSRVSKEQSEYELSEAIALDHNVLNDHELLTSVVEFVVHESTFSQKKLQNEFDLDFITLSSYLDTLRTLQLIDYKNERINNHFDLSDIILRIENARTVHKDLITRRRFESLKNHTEFEDFIIDLVTKLDYEIIEKVPLINNQSVDFLAIKDKVKFAFQCKFHNAPINYGTIKEIIYGVKFFDSHVGVVVTNNSFRKPARELADSNNIVLWDGDDLVRLINSINYL